MSILDPKQDAAALEGSAEELLPKAEAALTSAEDHAKADILAVLDGLTITVTISRKQQ